MYNVNENISTSSITDYLKSGLMVALSFFLIFLFLSITCPFHVFIHSFLSFPSALRWSHLHGRPFTCTRLHLLWLPPLSHLLYYHCSFPPLPFPSWALYCVQHILSQDWLVFQCFVEWKKHQFSPSVVCFLNFTSIPSATCLEPGLCLGWLQPISQVSVTLTSLMTIIQLRCHNLVKKKRLLDDLLQSLDLELRDLHCFAFTQLFYILQHNLLLTLKYFFFFQITWAPG